MNKSRLICRTVGISLLSFGGGVLASFFLPQSVLIVIESLIIIGVGLLYFSYK